MICDTLQHLTRYKGLCKNLDTAIDYLLTHDPASLPLGRTEVDGEEVFINAMDADAPSRPRLPPGISQKVRRPAARHHRQRGLGLYQQIPAGRSAILPATAVFRTAPVS